MELYRQQPISLISSGFLYLTAWRSISVALPSKQRDGDVSILQPSMVESFAVTAEIE